MVKEIGVNNFKYNILSMPMMKSVAFIGGCCFVLVLRMGEWNELTGHPKDCGKNQQNSRTNPLQSGRMMQIGSPIAEDHPNGDLVVRMRSHLCFISLSIFCYFIRCRVLGVFKSYFIRFWVLGYKYIFIASRKDGCY